MIWVAMNLLPTVLGAILICGVLAAGLSSAMGALIAVLMTLFYALPYQEAVAGVLPTLAENVS